METFDAINQRRSVKAFDPTHRLIASEETKLFEAAIQSPTSFNMQNWRFVVVCDNELRVRQPGEICVADASAETDLKGLEPVRKQLSNHLCIAVVSGSQRADADVVVGIHGECVEYNPVSGKICVWTQSDLKSE